MSLEYYILGPQGLLYIKLSGKFLGHIVHPFKALDSKHVTKASQDYPVSPRRDVWWWPLRLCLGTTIRVGPWHMTCCLSACHHGLNLQGCVITSLCGLGMLWHHYHHWVRISVQRRSWESWFSGSPRPEWSWGRIYQREASMWDLESCCRQRSEPSNFPESLGAAVLKLQPHQKYLECLLEHSLLGSAPRVTDSVGLNLGMVSKFEFPITFQVVQMLLLSTPNLESHSFRPAITPIRPFPWFLLCVEYIDSVASVFLSKLSQCTGMSRRESFPGCCCLEQKIKKSQACF